VLAFAVPFICILVIVIIQAPLDAFWIDPWGFLTTHVVVAPFLVLLLIILLSALRITISVDRQIQSLTMPYWHQTDAVRPGFGYAALLFIQPIFSRRRVVPLAQVKSILVCAIGQLDQYRDQYRPGSVARAIMDYRIWRASQWSQGFVMERQLFPSQPDLVFAVETTDDELLYRALYTLQPQDVVRLARLVQGEHPSLVHLSKPVSAQ
jgi:hypothetical protein